MLLSCLRGSGQRISHCHALRGGLQWCLGVRGTPLPHRIPLRLYGTIKGSVGRGWSTIVMYMAVPGGLAAYHMLRPSCLAVYCKQKQPIPIQDLATPTPSSGTQQPFNWTLFLKFILPDIILLVVAVGVSVQLPYIPPTVTSTPPLCYRVQW